MNTNIFYSHNLNERLDFVKLNGEYICTIKYYGFFIHLYLIGKDFVELYYNIHNNKIEEIELLDSMDERLNLFSIQVDLSDLYRQ